MAVSKRIRFEVLRRDNHTCRYCGGTAPDVVLTVDHVTPVALGGIDDPSNLVAACKDCNAGKTSTSPDAPLVADVAQDALRWARALAVATEDALRKRDGFARICDQFLERWNSWTFRGEPICLPGDWRSSVQRWLAAGVPFPIITDAMEIAMGRSNVRSEATFTYMAGVVWSKLREIQDAARAEIAPSSPASCGHCGDGEGECYIREEETPCPHCGDPGCLYVHGMSDGLPDGYNEGVRRARQLWEFSDVGYRILSCHADQMTSPVVDAMRWSA